MICVPNEIFKFEYGKSRNHFPQSVSFFENDPDQSPLLITLPEYPGRIRDISGYHNVTSGQKFIREPYPKELKALEKKHEGRRNDIYKDLFNNKRKHNDIIQWSVREWDRRLNGYWFFLKGQITYISGPNYFYLNNWHLDTGLPDFRDRDVLFFYVWEWVDNNPLCLGLIYMKHRREGATWRAGCINFERISRSEQSIGGIQSKNDTDAQNVYQKHIVRPFRKLSFIHKPIDNGVTDPKTQLDFTVGGLKKRRDKLTVDYIYSLESQINFMPMSEDAYDGWKLFFYHMDEAGKTRIVDVSKRWRVVRPAVGLGGGKALITSTVSEMEKKGGKNFKTMWEQSDHAKLNANNQTTSALHRFFLPAYIGLEYEKLKFFDEFGLSKIPEAKTFLENKREDLLEQGFTDDLNEEKRLYPFTVREAFRSGLSNNIFNTEKLMKRLEFFTFGNPYTIAGNFEWVDGVRGGYQYKGAANWVDGRVRFVPNPKGKWHISWLFTDPNQSNMKTKELNIWVPVNRHRFCIGSDSFKFNVVQGKRKSDGGGAIFMNYDPVVDSNPDESTWMTNDYIGCYLHRPPTKDEFAEDMLMACVYYSCEMNPEISLPDTWEYFIARGFPGYLHYTLDYRNQIAKTPGANMLVGFRNRMFATVGQWIEDHVHRAKHDRILTQMNEVTPETITDYDLFVAAGLAKVGAESRWIQVMDKRKKADVKNDEGDLPLTYYRYVNGKSVQINKL